MFSLSILILITFLMSPAFKRMIEGSVVANEIYDKLDKTEYYLIKDINMPTLGDKTQIEHVIVSRFGLFVIESKSMKGSIDGEEKQKDWTQTLHRRKSTFENPLQQNYKHLRALAHILRLSDDKFHSVILFTGKSTFNSPMPENVLDKNYINYIKSKDIEMFSKAEVNDFVERLKLFKVARTRSTSKKQVDYLVQPFRI